MIQRNLYRFGLLLVALLFTRAAPAWAADTAIGVQQLQRTAQALARMPKASANATLAARVSQEGLWTFINMAGENFTAATPDEVKRAVDVLLPGRNGQRLAVYLTGDSIFERSPKLAELPGDADLSLASGDDIYRLAKQGDAASAKYFAELKPNLLIELNSEPAFAEGLRQLARPLERQAFRVLSIEAGGPRALPASPRIDKATSRAQIDAIDPMHLASALGSLRNQTAVIVGRIEGDALGVKPASGPDRTLKWAELVASAEASDVNLLVLKASSAQQPGGRNWLWQKVEVKGLDHALGHATLADFFDALGGPGNRLVLSVVRPSPTRTRMDLRQASGLPTSQSSTAQITSVLSDVVSGLAGKVTHQGAMAEFRSASRDVELSRRLLPFLPSSAQWTYAALILLGLIGLPVAWRWWSRVWPAEQASEYPNALGYGAARGARGLAFALLFLPLVALAAGPTAILGRLRGLVRRKKPKPPSPTPA